MYGVIPAIAVDSIGAIHQAQSLSPWPGFAACDPTLLDATVGNKLKHN
jgi:hypothetical protein